MSYTITSNKFGTNCIVHVTDTTTLTVVGDHSTSDLALFGETLTGAYIAQIQWACPPGSYIKISRGGFLVGVFDSSNIMDFAGVGMPLFKAANKDLTIEFIGLGFCNIELQKIFTPLNLPDPEPEPPSFSILQLFSGSEPGFWYDPSDLSTLYQDSAGTTPVTAPGQTVGLLLDKSQGLTLGPERVTNGTFNSDLSGWSIDNASPPARQVTWTAGGARIQNDGSGNITLRQPNVFEANKSYRVTFTVTVASGGVDFLRGSTVIASISATGSYSYITGGAALERLAFARSGVVDVIVDNISVRELPGNHLTQPSLFNRPIYGIEPFGGRRNLLTYTEQFDNAVWAVAQASKASTTETVAAINNAPLWRVTEDTATNRHEIRQAVSAATIGQSYVLTVYAKNPATNGRRYVQLFTNISNDYANFDLQTGTLTAGTGTITLVETGVYRLTLPLTATSAGTLIYLALANSGTMTRAGTYTGNGASNMLFTGAQLETGSTATAYQRVTNQWNVTEAGVPSVSYLQFDGSDDWLVSPTITPGIDKAQVFAGVRKLSDAAIGTVAELSADSNSLDGSWGVFAPITSATSTYSFRSRGTALSAANSPPVFAAPITNVLTGVGDIAADTCILRINGVQAATSATDQGTGNYLAYPLYVGRRAGASRPFNGRLYQLIVRFGANLPLETIQQTEAWVNGKTGAY